MTPETLMLIFGWSATIYFSLALLASVHAWVVTSLLYSGVPLRNGAAMLSLVLSSQIHYYLWSPMIPSTALFALSAAGGSFPFVFTLSLFLFWTHILMYQLLSPSVILLGTSRNEMFRFRHKLERTLYPYRVVVLLEPSSSITACDGTFEKNLFEWDNLRTPEDAWRSSVFWLLDTVPTIVIDTRIPSEGVVEEIQRLSRLGHLSKCILVADEEGRTPALNAAGVTAPRGSVLCEASVAVFLKRKRLPHTTSPDDAPLLGGSR